jgi:cytochrome oxidase Cu insertion factor (SCO1/SenC/PrrC family)
LVLAIIIMSVGFGLKVFNKKTAEAQFGTTSSVLKSYSTGTPDIGGEYSLINQDREAVSNNTYLGRYTQIEHVKKIFQIYAVKSQQDEPDVNQYLMDHSAVSYLLGPDGKYVTFFRYGAEAEVISTKLKFFL